MKKLVGIMILALVVGFAALPSKALAKHRKHYLPPAPPPVVHPHPHPAPHLVPPPPHHHYR